MWGNRLAFLRNLADFLHEMTKIDHINERILRELAADGRVSNIQLAERVSLSPSACLRRVQDLERAGVIKGYKAVIDPGATGRSFVAMLGVGLSVHTKQSQEAFERAMLRAPQVRECHNTTGAIEYLLRVEVENLAAFKLFHTEILGTLPQVNSITTYVVMNSPKDDRA